VLYLLLNLLLVYWLPLCMCVCVWGVCIPKPVQRHGQVNVQSCAQLQLSGWGFNLICGVRTSLFTTSRKVLGSNFTTAPVVFGITWKMKSLPKLRMYEATPLLLYTCMTCGWVTLEAKLKHHALECMCQVQWKPAGTLSICTSRYMPCQKLDQNLTICKICGRHQGNTLRYKRDLN